MSHHEDHDSYIANKIYHFYLNRFGTNLSINTKEERSIDCHKAVLVAMSEYFRLMLDVGSADVDINVLELNTTSDIMKDVLQFIYKGTTDIHNDNVEVLLTQSINMKLHPLTLQCKDFIENNLSIDNVVQYHEYSMILQYEPLAMITSVYIKNNCTQLLSTGNFTQLSIGNLKYLLVYINAESVDERIKLDIILQWLTVHSDCNESAELLSAIQFDRLTIVCLKLIKDNPLLKEQHKLLIQESLNRKYEQELERQTEMLSKKQRGVKREQEILEGQHQITGKQLTWWFQHQQIKAIVIPVVIAIVISITIIIIPTRLQLNLQEPTQEEYLVMRTNNKQISRYDNSTNNWIEFMNVPDWVDHWTSWYASEHRIIIAGAHPYSVHADRVAVLDMKSRGVKELPRLPATRSAPGVVVDGDEVYIIGGLSRSATDTNTMYYTNIIHNNGWTTLPTIPTATCDSVTSIDSDHIYVFGCYRDKQTQVYNKHTQQWSRGATMPDGCHMIKGRCIKDGNKFTIINVDTMMEYNSNEDTWKIVKQYKPYDWNKSTSVVSYKGDILSCGIHKQNKISRYDADNDDVWTETDIDVSDIEDASYLFKVYI